MDHTRKCDDHSSALNEGSNQKQPSTSNGLDEKPGQGCEDSIDDHVDTTNQHGELMWLVQRVFHQNGKVINDSVAATNLLHELRRHAEKGSAEMLGLAITEDSRHWSRFATTTRCSDRVNDNRLLELNLRVIDRFTSESGKDKFALLIPFPGHKPARGLGKECHADADEKTKHNLEGNGESPGNVKVMTPIFAIGRVVHIDVTGGHIMFIGIFLEIVRALERIRGAVIDPIRNQGPERNGASFDADKETAIGVTRTLGLICGDGRSIDTISNSSDDTSNGKLGECLLVFEGSHLDKDTKAHDGSSKNDSTSTSKSVTDI